MALNWNIKNNKGFPHRKHELEPATTVRVPIECDRPAAARPWPLSSDAPEGRPPHQHRQTDNSQSVALRYAPLRVHSSCQADKRSISKGPDMATSSYVWCQNHMLGGFYCSIIGGHTARQDSWPNIQERAAPTVWSWETLKNARFQGFNCRVSQNGLMFGKAHCKPYVWYAFSTMSVTWINCTSPVHSHLIHVRNSWL